MAQALFFAALASLSLGLVVESLYCRECLLQTDEDGCLLDAGFCEAVDACKTFIFGQEETVHFRVYGCFMSDFFPCGMRRNLGGQTLSVECCSQGDFCNVRF